ncbi:hypothetical protein C0099_12860 [Pseudazoarcus pumilus]|uniref:Uncharacterized protein n=1 Tax=Pseudazoarcus pumilus TaxID=2067960 RepID=A0A2I6S912_9RHOO|nr:hypothetical protein C0099_12860 [Pseudazoarcus pumilus]
MAHAGAFGFLEGADAYGGALVVPYYTVQNGNVTLLNIVNVDPESGKAVKVRFRGAERSDDVFDFQVFLSPGDMWTANISQGPDGRARLTTEDNSCTLPENVNRSFETLRLSGDEAARAAGTREGYVEIINMGDVIDYGNDARTELFDAIKHVDGVAPCTPEILQSVVSGDTSQLNVDNDENGEAERLNDVATPFLYANVTILNLDEAAAWSMNAVPVDSLFTTIFSSEGLPETRYWSQTASKFDADLAQVTLDGVFLSGAVDPAQYDFPDLSTPRYPDSSPIEQYLITSFYGIGAFPWLSNEFITDQEIFAATDWLFSMPTRRYAVEGRPYEGGVVHLDTADFQGDDGRGVLFPFSEYYDADTGCVRVAGLEVQDREERILTPDVVVSPGTTVRPQLCGEVAVMSFNRKGATRSGVLGAELTLNDITVPYENGHASFLFGGGIFDELDFELGYGLPVIAQAFVRANNGGSGAANMNFGGNWKHRGFSLPFGFPFFMGEP